MKHNLKVQEWNSDLYNTWMTFKCLLFNWAQKATSLDISSLKRQSGRDWAKLALASRWHGKQTQWEYPGWLEHFCVSVIVKTCLLLYTKIELCSAGVQWRGKEMARQFTALAALSWDSSWLPSSHIRQLTATCNSSPRACDIPFGPPQTALARMYIHCHPPTHAHTHT